VALAPALLTDGEIFARAFSVPLAFNIQAAKTPDIVSSAMMGHSANRIQTTPAMPPGREPTWYDVRRTSQSPLPNGVQLSYYRHATPISKPKEIAMESIISNLLSRFEKGSLSRRELVQGLAMLAASGTATSAQEDINFKTANVDHVSVQVGNLQKSIDFYQKMFGFGVVSQAEEGGVKIVRLGNTKTLVSLNVGGPPGRVDHFAIGIPRFTRESINSYLVQRGATPLQGDFAGLHIKDPDGVNVQISSQT
jgi:catechol 2,3-dioxygenase-like lactoylglutathione lyase family enzyme